MKLSDITKKISKKKKYSPVSFRTDLSMKGAIEVFSMLNDIPISNMFIDDVSIQLAKLIKADEELLALINKEIKKGNLQCNQGCLKIIQEKSLNDQV